MDRKKKIIIGLVIFSILLALGLIYYFYIYKNKGQAVFDQRQFIENQLKELERIRLSLNLKTLTAEEQKAQLEDMEKIRIGSSFKLISEQEMRQQLEELDKLRRQMIKK